MTLVPLRWSPTGSAASATCRSPRGSSTGAAAVVLVALVPRCSELLWQRRCSRGAPRGARSARGSRGSCSGPLARRRAGALGRPLRCSCSRPRSSATTDPIREPRADLDLRRLLARPARALVALRQRVARAQPVARDRRRRRLGLGAARAARRGRSRPTPSGSGRWPGRSRAVRVRRRSSSRTPIPSSPRALGVRDRDLHVRDALRDGRLRARRPGASAGRASRSCSRYFARIAPLAHAATGGIRLRWPLTGLAGAERVPGSARLHRGDARHRSRFDGYSRTERPGRT